jgi:hypothetical protein
MAANTTTHPVLPCRGLLPFVVAACFLLARITVAQGLTGALIGTVTDDQGGILSGAAVRASSPALIGGVAQLVTNEKGQLRFPALPPGSYVLDIECQGFMTYHEEHISIGAGATIERTAVLKLAGLAESVVVEGAGSVVEARHPGFGTRFAAQDLQTIPTRRSGMFDFIRTAPGISATSQGSSTGSLISAFGSGANENTFLIDGTNFTSTTNGVARAEPGIDFIQEIQIQSVGASAEYGGAQGGVVNIVTKQGSDRFLNNASYFAQPAALTSQPVRLGLDPNQPATGKSGYERARYRDFMATLGGPVVRDRLWFFTGYQYLRDYDSQPGTDPNFPKTYEQNKVFAKLTWRLPHGWQLVQSIHDEFWVNPEVPTSVKPFQATQYQHASVPAMTFGHLSHSSANTVWDVRAGRVVFSQETSPSAGSRGAPSRFDTGTGVTTGAPQQVGSATQIRSTAKATLGIYRPGIAGVDQEWKMGGQIDKGEHRALTVVPTGVRYIDNKGQPAQAITIDPANAGGLFITTAAFASDALTVGSWLTINAGIRFDHSRAVSQDLRALDVEGHDTGHIVRGLGTLYTWNVLSPRLGVTAKLTADGRTLLRGSYGRFNQGILTGELGPLHPGQSQVTTADFDPATSGYTRNIRVIDPKINLLIDPDTRTPRTDAYSIGMDHQIGHGFSVSTAYVHKDGAAFIGWTDVGGQYRDGIRTLADGRTLPVSELVNAAGARRFLLTNPEGYSLTYNALVTVVEKRRAHGWQAFGSYTFSRVYGLQAYSGTTAAGPQVSTVGAPPGSFSPPITFGRDPNDLTNAGGRLPNDRPHMFRATGSMDLLRTGFVFAASLQISSGKPWAATAPVAVPQNSQQRILLEPRGARRLPSQTLLDLRVSRTIAVGGLGRVELLVNVLNALNDTAAEGIATDNLFSPNFGQPTVFMDPRRAMVGVRLNLGR